MFCGETVISSSAIRRLLSEGEVEDAGKLLGRLYEYRGTVIAGDGRGHRIGFPTANLDGDNEMLLAEGVYATWALIDGKLHRSVTNIGRNPTFIGERPVHAEVHILDYTADLYKKEIALCFVKRLRGEKQFSGIDALCVQIRSDSETARTVLA